MSPAKFEPNVFSIGKVRAVVMFFVCFLPLALLVYVGLQEARRTYAEFLFENMSSQGGIVQRSMAWHLRSGVPLRHFVGFQNLSGQLLNSDPTILLVLVTDRSDRVIFVNKRHGLEHPSLDLLSSMPSTALGEVIYTDERYEVRQSESFIGMSLHLKSQLDVAGRLWIVIPRHVIHKALDVALIPMLCFVALVSGFFAWFVLAAGSEVSRNWRQKLGLVACHLSSAIVMLGLLLAVHSSGMQVRERAFAASLGGRIDAVFDSNIDLSVIDGTENLLRDYLDHRENIESIGLLLDGVFTIHTDPKRTGTVWTEMTANSDFKVAIASDSQGRKQEIVVRLRTWGVSKSLRAAVAPVLFITVSCGLFAALLLWLAQASLLRYARLVNLRGLK